MRTDRVTCPIALLGAASLLAASALLAAPPRAEEIADPNITAPEIRAHVRYLASPELEGRGSGTKGNDLAAEYIAARFRAAGLKPAGENGSFFQSFPVFTGVKVGPGNQLALKRGSVTTRLAVGTGSESTPPPHGPGPAPPRRTPEPHSGPVKGDFLPLSFSANGAVTAPLVFVGYGISAPDLSYDDYKGIDVRGKIAVILRHTPDGDDTGKFGPYALLTYKTLTAREKGAAGVLLLTGPMTEGPENLGVFRLSSASSDCGIPAAIVKRSFVERLIAPKKLRDLQVMMAHGQPQSFAIPGASATLRANVLRQTARTRNVIGLLEGSDPRLKDEVVVVGAHFDHLGLGGEHSLSGASKPEIHHGADDNASGTAGIIELAQYFAANRDRLGRSVLFMGFSGEELGLLGSNYWSKQPTIPLGRVAAMINLDMIGRMRNDSVFVIGTDSSPAWAGLLETVNQPHGLKLQTKGGSIAVGLGASDQQSFYIQKIPVLFFFTGVHPDYHRPSDTWDKVEVDGQTKLLRLVADTVQAASRVTPRPQFTESKDQAPTSSPGFRVSLGTIPDYAAAVEGVALSGVRPGSPADKGGIRGGDILVEFDGKKIRNVQEYTAVLATARPNVPVKLVVLRNKERVTLTVTPAARGN